MIIVAEKIHVIGDFGIFFMDPRRTDRVSDCKLKVIRDLKAVSYTHLDVYKRQANFSGGMQQRVQISKALANNPAILLLDEVTTGLDLSVQARVLELIREIRREFHVSILLVSHDLAVIRMLACLLYTSLGR